MNILRSTAPIKAFALLLILFVTFSRNASAIGVCSSISTNSAVSVPVGPNPRQVLLGDLNGDNAPDSVVVTGSFNSSGGTASVLLNNGRGGLSAFTATPVNFSVSAAGLADFNLDGALDLAVAGSSNFSGGGAQLNVYPGNGDGSFEAAATTTFQGSATALSTGDFNNDGLPDIAVASTGNSFGVVSLFLNAGFGSFNFNGNFPVSSSPRDLKNADFNGDGNLDIIVANSNGTASLLFGNGVGSFQAATGFNLFTGSFSSSGISFAVGDVNNDGRPDVAAANGDSSIFTVILNNGNGVFAAPITNTFSDFNFRPRAITIGQFTGDGNADIAVAINTNFSDSLSAAVIVPGSGTAAFNVNNLTIAATGSAPVSIISGDLSGDGRNDLVTANSGSGDISILLNNGSDRYGSNTFPTNGFPNQIVAADFNADGNIDTAVSNAQTSFGSNNPNGIVISYGNGMGGVSSVSAVNLGPTTALATDDVNNDNRADLISLSGNNQLMIFVNNGGSIGSPPNATITLSFTARAIITGDFNNDGKKDIVIGNANGNTIAVLLGQGTGAFSAPTILASPANSPLLTAADFNNDGNLDLALTGSGFTGTTGVFTLLGSGTGTFSQVSEIVAVTSPGAIIDSDFNGDGKIDIALVGGSNFSSGPGSITVAFGDGDGTFSQPAFYPSAFSPSGLTTADFNGDNLPDLAYSVRPSNSYSILLNTGKGSFRSGGTFLAGIFPEVIAAGDFDNDGRNDLVTANRGGNNFSILINECQEAVTKTDFTGEGKTDFAVFRPSNGTWSVRDANGAVKSRQFGLEGDIPTPGDYDGDGTSDFAIFRPSSSTWFVTRSSNNLTYAVKWGATGDIPTANDFDGDGKTDIAVFRPSNGVWYVVRSSNPNSFYAVHFGGSGDRPVAADYDGDGRADIAVYRGGLWIILQSSNSVARFQQFGIASDRAVPGDFDGDGKTDLGVYRNGVWFIFQSKTNSLRVENFGLANDVPQPGDYDGDGKTDIAVYRPEGNNWYVIQSASRSFKAVNFGTPNDIPVSSIYRY